MKWLFVANDEHKLHAELGAFRMRGLQIGRALARQFGHEVAYTHQGRLGQVHGPYDVVVFVKTRPRLDVPCAKDAIIVFDPIDSYGRFNADTLGIAHLVLLPNQTAYRDHRNSCRDAVSIQHHHDATLVRPVTPTLHSPRFVYVGWRQYLPDYLHRDLSVTKIYQTEFPSVPRRIGNFNVHFNLRNSETMPQAFKYKPITKVAFAAACVGSVIITVREDSVLEYPSMQSYPYYVNSVDQSAVYAMMQTVRNTYGGPVWKHALACLAEVRRRTTIEYITKEYNTGVTAAVRRYGQQTCETE
jgi:hypothetical protein